MADKSKTLIGDVFEILSCDRSFVTPQMFAARHLLDIDYGRLEIRIDGRYTLRLEKLTN